MSEDIKSTPVTPAPGPTSYKLVKGRRDDTKEKTSKAPVPIGQTGTLFRCDS